MINGQIKILIENIFKKKNKTKKNRKKRQNQDQIRKQQTKTYYTKTIQNGDACNYLLFRSLLKEAKID